MAFVPWQATIQTDTGDAVASASIEVRSTSTGTPLATLYSDANGAEMVNPFTTGADGFAQFYADVGQYTIAATANGSTQTFVENLSLNIPYLATRDEFVVWATKNSLPDGSVVPVGGVQYEADSTSTAISDLTGWVPFDDVTPLHWGAARDGVTDDTAAIAAAVAYWQGTAFGIQLANNKDRALYFPSGPYYSAAGMVISTSGTGQVFRGDGQQATRLISIGIKLDDRHCSVYGLSMTGAGNSGIELANPDRRYGAVKDVHIRDKTYGILYTGGKIDSFTDCLIEKNKYNLYVPEDNVAAAGGADYTSCAFLAATVNNIFGVSGEHRFSNCRQANASSVGMLIKSREPINGSAVECYFSQMSNSVQQIAAFFDVTAVADAGGGDVTVTAANTFTAGDFIDIFGTTSYNGTHTVISATDTAFVVTAAFAASETGVTRRIHDRVWRVTGVADAGGGNIEITTDGAHDLVPKLTGLTISGSTSYDAVYDVIDVTATNKFTVAATFVASETGVAAILNWDVVIDGEGTTGLVNDMFFTGGNINYLKIKDSYNITFTGTRLKQQIWLEGANDRIMLKRSRRGRNSDAGSRSDILVGGPGSHTGWAEIAMSDPDNTINNDNIRIGLATPNTAAGVGVSNHPLLNDLRVTNTGMESSVAGVPVLKTDSTGLIAPQNITGSGNLILVGGASASYLNLGGTNLDTYEQGTWTPILGDGTNNATLSTAVGAYTRVGRVVEILGRVTLTSVGSVSGGIQISGLPFVTINSSAAPAATILGNSAALTLALGEVPFVTHVQNVSYVILRLWGKSTSGSNQFFTDANLTATSQIRFSHTYITA